MKIPTNLKDAKAIRDFFTGQRQALNGLVTQLADPWKTHFTGLDGQYEQMLALLPADTEAGDPEKTANVALALFSQTNALCALLGANIKTSADALVAARITSGELIAKADLDTHVTTALNGKVTAGELFTKERHTQLCTEAEARGEKKVRDEIALATEAAKVIETRKGEVATAGLPIPDADMLKMLAGTPEEFAARKTKAESRIEKLRTDGIVLNAKSPLLAKVWLDDTAYAAWEQIAKEAFKGAGQLTPPGPGDTGPKILAIV